MSRLAASFVLGYHGCDAKIAKRVVNGELKLLPSDKNYDWLGPGAYFWEADPQRANEWAEQAKAQKKIQTPAVIGAVIDLGNCLDLLNRENLDLVRLAHQLYVADQSRTRLSIPQNRDLKGGSGKILRYLDCAVIRFLHQVLEKEGAEPFDTVRGFFPEGQPLYEGAGFQDRNHIQIAVCNVDKLLGVFYPPGHAPD